MDLFGDKWSYGAQLGQRPLLRDEINSTFRPKKSITGSASKCAHQNARAFFRFAGEQLGQVGVGQVTCCADPAMGNRFRGHTSDSHRTPARSLWARVAKNLRTSRPDTAG